MANSIFPVKRPMTPAIGSTDVWQSLRTEMDRLFDRFTSGLGMPPFQALRGETAFSVSSPAVDVNEDEKCFKLTAEFPGLTEKDIEVSVSGNTLVIRGEKKQEKEQKEKGYYLSERSYGEFQRSFELPDGVDSSKIEASTANGVLTVIVPKSAGAEPKKIEVKAAA